MLAIVLYQSMSGCDDRLLAFGAKSYVILVPQAALALGALKTVVENSRFYRPTREIAFPEPLFSSNRALSWLRVAL